MSKNKRIFIGVLALIITIVTLYFTFFYKSLNGVSVGQNTTVTGTANKNKSDIHPLSEHIMGIVTMLVVNDLDRSVAFYRDKLGFKVIKHNNFLAALTNGGMNLYLFTKSSPSSEKPGITLENLNKPGKTSVIIDILVDDTRVVYKKLSELGVKFLAPPRKRWWHALRCFAVDPDGYLIEIEEGENSPFF